MASSTEEEENFFRVYKLVIGIGTEAVRNTFDDLFHPGSLDATLKTEEPTIKLLQQQRRITSQQMPILFPQNGSPSSSEFDITLMVCLIRNLKLVKPVNPPIKGYDKLPLQNELGVGADLARMKYYRNKYAHSTSKSLSNTDYQAEWKDISEAIIRLGNPNCKQICDDLKNEKMSSNIMIDLANQITEDRQQTENQIQMIETKFEKVTQDTKTKLREVTIDTETQISSVNIAMKDIQTQMEQLKLSDSLKFKELTDKITHFHNQFDIKDWKSKALEDTEALMEQYEKEDTFVKSLAFTQGLSMLESRGQLVITGNTGAGKSRLALEIARLMCGKKSDRDKTDNTKVFKTIKLDYLDNFRNIDLNDKCVVLLDDIFGQTNCHFDHDRDMPILDKILAYVGKGNVKVIITVRNSLKRYLQPIFEKHRLFEHAIDISSENFEMSADEKVEIILKYLAKYYDCLKVSENGLITSEDNVIVSDLFQITRSKPLLGFPQAVYMFASNPKYTKLGCRFFEHPTKECVTEIDNIRKRSKLSFAVLVYTVLNGNELNPKNDTDIQGVSKAAEFIYDQTFEISKITVLDSIDELCGAYLIQHPHTEVYCLQHQILVECVLLSIANIDPVKVIPLLDFEFIITWTSCENYVTKDGEVVLKIPLTQYKNLADRLIYILFSNSVRNPKWINFFTAFLCASNFITRHDENLTYTLLDSYSEAQRALFPKFIFNAIAEIGCEFDMPYHLCESMLSCLTFTGGNNQIVKVLLQYFDRILNSRNQRNLLNRYRENFIKSVYYLCGTGTRENMSLAFMIAKKNNIFILFSIEESCFMTDTKLCENEKQCIWLFKCLFNAYISENIETLQFLLTDSKLDLNMVLQQLYACPSFFLERLKKNTTGNKIKPFFLPNNPLAFVLDCTIKSLEFMLNGIKQNLIDEKPLLRLACEQKLSKTAIYLFKRFKPAKLDLQNYMKITLDFNEDCKSVNHFEVGYSYENDYSLRSCQIVAFLIKEMRPTLSDLYDFIAKSQHVHNYNLIQCILENRISRDQINLDSIMHTAMVRCEFAFVKWSFSYFDTFCAKYGNQVAIELVCGGKFVDSCYQTPTSKENEEQRIELLKFLWESCQHDSFDMYSAVRKAFSVKRLSLVIWIFKNCDLDIESSGLDPQCIMEMACSQGNNEGLLFLFEKINISRLAMEKSIMLTIIGYTDIMPYPLSSDGIIQRNSVNPTDDRYVDVLSTLWDKIENKTGFETKQALKTLIGSNKRSIIKWVLDNLDNELNDIEMTFLSSCQKSYPEVIAKIINITDVSMFDLRGILTGVCTQHESEEEDDDDEEEKDKLNVLKILLEKVHHSAFDDFHEAAIASIYNEEERLFHYLLSSVNPEQFKIMELFKMVWDAKKVNLAIWMVNNIEHTYFDVASIIFEACVDTVKICEIDRMIIIYPLWRDLVIESFDFEEAIQTACYKKRFFVVLFLLIKLKQAPFNLQIILNLCLKFNQIDVVKIILSMFSLDYLDIKLALVEACCSDSDETDVVNYLLSNFKRDSFDKMTVDKSIFLAVKEKNYNIVLLLLEHFSVNVQNMLDISCKYGAVEIVQHLVNKRERIDNVNSCFLSASKCSTSDQMDCIKCLEILWDIFDHNHFDLRNAIKLAKRKKNTYVLDWLENKSKSKNKKKAHAV